MRRRRSFTKLVIWVVMFGTVFVGVFFGVQFLTKTGIFKVPGVIYYSDSLSSEEKTTLTEIFKPEVVLDKDLTISARNVLTLPELKANEFLVEVYVPVTGFYSTKDNIEVASAPEIFDSGFQTLNDFELIPVSELSFSKKLLAVNSDYYLDKFTSGAVFRVIEFDSEKYDEEIKPKVESALSRQFPTAQNVLTFAQTGVTALSRAMNKKLVEVGGDAAFFAREIGPFLSGFDITHTSNESSFSDYATSNNICSDKRFIGTLTEIGLDVVELTGNHNQDCGDSAAVETIDTYTANGIKIVGGGKTAGEAAVPLEISEKGSNITMLAFNQSTGGATMGDSPGANQYHEETAASQISEAKARGDLIIVDVQYYECSAYASEYEDTTCDYADSSAGDQIGFFRHLIDLGADVVVGTSAHQPQTFELYGGGAIYYGLGNLFFDQIWWPGTTRSLVLAHYIHNNKILQTRILPTVYGEDMQTKLMAADEARAFIERLAKVSP